MLEKIKTAFARLKVYSLWVLTGILSAGLCILAFMLRSKNKKIQELQTEIALKAARLELEQVLLKHQLTIAEINKLREEDSRIAKEIEEIEGQLKNRLSENLTAEQIADRFRELGI